jgi:hypothetical protein
MAFRMVPLPTFYLRPKGMFAQLGSMPNFKMAAILAVFEICKFRFYQTWSLVNAIFWYHHFVSTPPSFPGTVDRSFFRVIPDWDFRTSDLDFSTCILCQIKYYVDVRSNAWLSLIVFEKIDF